MLLKKIKLEKALEAGAPLSEVKEYFQDYIAAYKRLRNPQEHHHKDFERLYTKFDKYEKEHKNEH